MFVIIVPTGIVTAERSFIREAIIYASNIGVPSANKISVPSANRYGPSKGEKPPAPWLFIKTIAIPIPIASPPNIENN